MPSEVIKATAEACLEFNNSGLSLMEISHRSKDFQPVMDEAEALMKELLDIPEGYKVLFLGGGASLEFCTGSLQPFGEKSRLPEHRNMGKESH